MAGVNKVILLGNLGKDPEVRHFDNGGVVANFTLATSESYKNKAGEKIDSTEWHEVEVWDKLAEIVEKYLHKGDSIYMEGKIKTDKWQAEDGTNRKTVKVRGTTLTMLPKSDKTSSEANKPAAAAPVSNNAVSESDDLPF